MELAAAGLSVRAQQQILRDIAVRVRQGRPVPANPLLLADQREGLIEEGDPIDPPASSSPRCSHALVQLFIKHLSSWNRWLHCHVPTLSLNVVKRIVCM